TSRRLLVTVARQPHERHLELRLPRRHPAHRRRWRLCRIRLASGEQQGATTCGGTQTQPPDGTAVDRRADAAARGATTETDEREAVGQSLAASDDTAYDGAHLGCPGAWGRTCADAVA